MAGKKKTGLGRGLDALIVPQNTHLEDTYDIEKKTPAVHSKNAGTIIKKPSGGSTTKKERSSNKVSNSAKNPQKTGEEIPPETLLRIDEIEPGQGQPRKYFNEDALNELADSIKTHGLIQPLVVSREGKTYRIIAGERRWRAARMAGLKKIPVIIREYSPEETVEIALIENLQREDLNPIEEAEAYQRLIEEYGLSQDEAALKVSKSRSAVTNSLRLLKLDSRVRQMIIDEMISSGHGRTLLGLSEGDAQYQLALKIFDDQLSVRETERIIKNMLKPGKTRLKTDPRLTDIYRDIEEKMTGAMGTKVRISPRSEKRGRIEIEYYSPEDLERISSLLAGKEPGLTSY